MEITFSITTLIVICVILFILLMGFYWAGREGAYVRGYQHGWLQYDGIVPNIQDDAEQLGMGKKKPKISESEKRRRMLQAYRDRLVNDNTGTKQDRELIQQLNEELQTHAKHR